MADNSILFSFYISSYSIESSSSLLFFFSLGVLISVEFLLKFKWSYEEANGEIILFEITSHMFWVVSFAAIYYGQGISKWGLCVLNNDCKF